MQHTRVRKIPSKRYRLPSEKWDDGWLDPTLNLAKRFMVYSIPRLARWSGPAILAGGMLWSVLLVLIHLQLDFYWLYPFTRYVSFLFYYLNLAVPMLLFMLGLIGLYTRYAANLTKIGKVGFYLCFIGLATAILTTLGSKWLRLDVWIDSLADRDEEFERLFTILNMPDPFEYWSIFGWFTAAHLGFLILSTGLLLLWITLMRKRALPRWIGMILLISTLSIHVPSLLNSLPLDSYELEDMIYTAEPSTALLIFFGYIWAITGFAFLQNTNAKLRRT